MKKTLFILAASLAAASAFAQTPVAEPVRSAYSVTADFTYVTDYVFRGVQRAEESLQPSVKFTSGNFYAGVWSDIPLDKGYELQVDAFAGYHFSLSRNWKLDAGARLYNYPGLDTPGADKTTFEPYVGFNGKLFGLTSGTYAFYDTTLKVSTFQQSLGYEIVLDKKYSLLLTGSGGMVDPDAGAKYNYWNFGLMIPCKVNQRMTFTFGIQYAANDISTIDDAFWGVFGLNYKF